VRARGRLAVAFWLLLAVLGPSATAGTLVGLRRYDLLARIGLDFDWPSWIPSTFWGLFLFIILFAVAIVTAAGLFGRWLAFSIRDVDPDARAPWLERLLPGEDSDAAKPAVKNAAPYG
jgi:hypothetical protein